jgi:hypothetical protein
MRPVNVLTHMIVISRKTQSAVENPCLKLWMIKKISTSNKLTSSFHFTNIPRNMFQPSRILNNFGNKFEKCLKAKRALKAIEGKALPAAFPLKPFSKTASIPLPSLTSLHKHLKRLSS